MTPKRLSDTPSYAQPNAARYATHQKRAAWSSAGDCNRELKSQNYGGWGEDAKALLAQAELPGLSVRQTKGDRFVLSLKRAYQKTVQPPNTALRCNIGILPLLPE